MGVGVLGDFNIYPSIHSPQIASHEHFLPLNLPHPFLEIAPNKQPHKPYWVSLHRTHFLAGLFLNEVNLVLQHCTSKRQLAIE